MAFTNFYIDSGGHDMAAGTVVNAAASVTSTNGDWGNAAANRFTAAAGTPFSAVQVGEWASIYVDGTTSGAVYVAQVTAINASGASIDLSTTAKYGTAPSNSATGRSCKIGGSWLSELPLTTMTNATPASTKVNVKGNLTITASRTIAWAGTTTAPLWIDGYSSSPGDLDTDLTNSLTKPVWTVNATFGITANGAYTTFSNISVTGNRSSAVWTGSGPPSRYVRMRFENTSSNAGALAANMNIAGVSCYYCYFKAPTTATTSGTVSIGNSSVWMVGCVAEGGGLGCYGCTTTVPVFINCIALNGGAAGWSSSTGGLRLLGCTASGCVDGVKWSGTPNNVSMIVGCLFRSCSTGGINNASGTNTDNVFMSANDFYNCGTNVLGMGDAVQWFGQTDSADPVISASNMTPISTSNAWAHGFPGVFENESFASYVNIGAVQQSPAALFIPVE